MTIYLQTERLRLRRLTPDDLDNLVELDSDPEVRRYLDMPTAPTREEEQQTLLRLLAWYDKGGDYGFWAAEAKEVESGNRFVGWFHFRPYRPHPEEIEVGYRLKPAFWGRGYATEVSRALLQKGFVELGIEHIVATTLVENRASRHVMEKIGLTLEAEYLYDNRLPAVKYGLYREDYLKQHQYPERCRAVSSP